VSAIARRRRTRSVGQDGSSLVVVLLLMFLLSAIAMGMAVVCSVETTVASRFVQATQALFAAEAAVNIAVAELRPMADWTPVLAGVRSSTLSDGAFAGVKRLPAGGTVALCCGSSSVSGRLARENGLSGAFARRALVWRPFLWAPLATLLPASSSPGTYIVVFVQDDEDDGDGSGITDLNGRVVVRAEAVQPDGLRRSVEALVARERGDPLRGLAPAVRLLRWREVR
jgi:hypothetical protein